MAEKPETIRTTDDEARQLGRNLIRQARSAAMAVLDPGSGDPMASRVLTGTDIDGCPVILISALAPHMAALRADPRASLLFGLPGKGDPLAHPRITVKAEACEIRADAAPEAQGEQAGESARARIRRRFLARQPKAALYADFPDFAFFRLQPVSASLNGGFGRAYQLCASDLLIASPASSDLAAMEAGAVAHMNSDHPDAADTYARAFAKSNKSGWKVIGMDCAGLDLALGDAILRVDFDKPLEDAAQLRTAVVSLLTRARQLLS
ncbi:HugZ family protein [Pseudohoeflea coraliihabitans]|uniref:DUF2470 domain-containing protein n=1 Tax=Pseudohoeflea coraliihabitans TaxID=2860393 RepID=A0ABS6WJW9_9HYPH|nr:DUF2470 domain-containing protein [Pseudohoeflea sp. DP4N28-3]MBW3096160.1 DUF2470 domain-containing protein [Pseudohoeflea sp. DP4N28-3]